MAHICDPKVDTPACSGQGQGEQQWQLGVHRWLPVYK